MGDVIYVWKRASDKHVPLAFLWKKTRFIRVVASTSKRTREH